MIDAKKLASMKDAVRRDLAGLPQLSETQHARIFNHHPKISAPHNGVSTKISIQFSDEQSDWIRTEARRRQCSCAEIVRLTIESARFA